MRGTLYRLLLLSDSRNDPTDLLLAMEWEGFNIYLAPDIDASINGRADVPYDAAVLDLDSVDPNDHKSLLERCNSLGLPVVGVFSSATRLGNNISLDEIDDFVVRPFHTGELHFRIQQSITKLRGNPGQFITKVGDLTIDTERYEVSVAGRRVILTFKEYQLLLLMASTPGRVYKRDVLLNQIWGYDYFGGTRTVDVHIRRIRAKIEDSNHTFIETIRNVGYRFKP